MQVIGAGFGRTGTNSMKAALEQLGFGPCYHMVDVMADVNTRIVPWEQAANGEQVDWKQALDGFGSIVDWPGCTYYKELMTAFPEAKVLLTVRDPESWHKSVMKTIYPLISGEKRLTDLWESRAMPTLDKSIWRGPESTFKDNFADKDFAIQVFNDHIEDVKRTVPADRLCVYNVGDGWEPLCEFLGVDVPDTPYPHNNSGEDFQGVVNEALSHNE